MHGNSFYTSYLLTLPLCAGVSHMSGQPWYSWNAAKVCIKHQSISLSSRNMSSDLDLIYTCFSTCNNMTCYISPFMQEHERRRLYCCTTFIHVFSTILWFVCLFDVLSATVCNFIIIELGPSWLWSYGSWIYNYLCNQCLSPLMLWVRTPYIHDEDESQNNIIQKQIS
jgi:hypothetical protein